MIFKVSFNTIYSVLVHGNIQVKHKVTLYWITDYWKEFYFAELQVLLLDFLEEAWRSFSLLLPSFFCFRIWIVRGLVEARKMNFIFLVCCMQNEPKLDWNYLLAVFCKFGVYFWDNRYSLKVVNIQPWNKMSYHWNMWNQQSALKGNYLSEHSSVDQMHRLSFWERRAFI